MSLSIRAAMPTDLPAMMALEKHAVTAAHWSVEQYEALFRASKPGRIALTIQEEARRRGFVIASVVGEEWEIDNFAIAGRARRRGLGTRRLGEFLDLGSAKGAHTALLEDQR